MDSLTFGDLEALACGEIGLRLETFYDMSFKEWFAVTKGYYNKQERQIRLTWETTRAIMYSNLLPHQKKGSNLTPEKVLPLLWDIQEKVQEETTPEDIEAVKKFWEEKDKQRNAKE